jgi:hypothetical protein
MVFRTARVPRAHEARGTRAVRKSKSYAVVFSTTPMYGRPRKRWAQSSP